MRRLALLLTLGLLSCGKATPLDGFRGTTPAMDPIRFFTGHVKSWGVLENRSGEPTNVVATDCLGESNGDVLRMVQQLTVGQDAPTTRTWQMRLRARRPAARFTGHGPWPCRPATTSKTFRWTSGGTCSTTDRC